MATMQERLDRAAATPVTGSEPKYVRLLTTDEYSEAQSAVDRLSDRGFPVHHTAIVGEGIQLFERITGRRDWLRAMVDGAVDGFAIGLVLGVVLSLLTVHDPALSAGVAIATSIIAGVVLGALIRLATHLSYHGRRDFSSIQSLRAVKYSLLCEVEHAEKARELLSD